MTESEYGIPLQLREGRESLWVLGHDIFEVVAEPFPYGFVRSDIVEYEIESAGSANGPGSQQNLSFLTHVCLVLYSCPCYSRRFCCAWLQLCAAC